MTAPNLFEQQASNRRRSFWLVAGFIIFFAWVGFGGDAGLYLETRDAAAGSITTVIPFIGIVVTLIAGGVCWYSWKNGANRVLWATGAWEVIEPADDDQRRLVNVVEEMAIAAGLPRAAGLGGSGFRSQRVRDRHRSAARQHRGDRGPAAHAQPRGAAGVSWRTRCHTCGTSTPGS